MLFSKPFVNSFVIFASECRNYNQISFNSWNTFHIKNDPNAPLIIIHSLLSFKII